MSPGGEVADLSYRLALWYPRSTSIALETDSRNVTIRNESSAATQREFIATILHTLRESLSHVHPFLPAIPGKDDPTTARELLAFAASSPGQIVKTEIRETPGGTDYFLEITCHNSPESPMSFMSVASVTIRE